MPADAGMLALFLGAALLLAVTPGPGIFYVAARAMAGERAEGIASSIGTAIGGMVHVVAGAVGVSALVLASAEAFTAVKVAGAIYLVWLGVKTMREARNGENALDAAVPPTGAARAFRDGIVVEALNPKTAAFFLAFLPQFLDPSAGSIAAGFLLLGTISVAFNTGVDVLVAIGAGALRTKFGARAGLLARLRVASGAGLIALGAMLALVRRPAN